MKTTMTLMMILLLGVSCTTRKAGWDKKEITKPMNAANFKIGEEEAMTLWKQRADQESLKRALVLFKDLHLADPTNPDILVYLTRGYYLLADAHLVKREEKIKTFEKAISYGEMGMALNPTFKAEVKKHENVEKALPFITKAEAPITYWTAAALGKWSKLRKMSVALKYRSQVKAMIKKVEELEPDYFHGAVPRYWGAFYAIMPKISGGNLSTSKENFMKSIASVPEYLGTKVLMAEVYWTKRGKKKEFTKILEEVLASKDDGVEELAPENKLEKIKARKLLARKKKLF